tara:strand:- start:180 stop:377 length:198 start_codon:yes stop_codon:yes gene_type:complete
MTDTDHKVRASAWFATLRDQICDAFEAIEDDLDGPTDSPFADRPAGSSGPAGIAEIRTTRRAAAG